MIGSRQALQTTKNTSCFDKVRDSPQICTVRKCLGIRAQTEEFVVDVLIGLLCNWESKHYVCSLIEPRKNIQEVKHADRSHGVERRKDEVPIPVCLHDSPRLNSNADHDSDDH